MSDISVFLDEIIESAAARERILCSAEKFPEAKMLACRIAAGEELIPERGLMQLLVFAHLSGFALERFLSLGVPRDIAIGTLRDINVWINNYASVSDGEIGVSEFDWLKLHYRAELFRIGRLQFRAVKPSFPTPTEKPFVIETHIPEGEPLSYEACLESFSSAEKFFSEIFPECRWDLFVCDSWLLNPALEKLLPEVSNIVRFMKLWTPTPFEPDFSAQAIERVFGFGKTRAELESLPAKTRLARELKKYLLSGGELNITAGYRKRGEGSPSSKA